MNTRRRSKRLAILIAAAGCCPAPAVLAQQLAFPEAEGFGRFATGARTSLSSASVYHVTNLNDSGAGSFRDAVSQSNRFVVFDVGGIVNLNSVVTFASNLTIAGQTAPGGFSLYSDRAAFHGANNLISRHFAVRAGTSIGREDAASIVRGTNMMFDHMSITWGVDGTFDINPDSGQVIDNLTIQNSIISQGLDVVGHSTGGLMTLGEGHRFSIIKSLFADNVTRNPKVRGENEFINNVVYGYETSGYIMGDTSATSHANVEGNYFIEGPTDGSSPFASGTSTFHIYARDNWVDGNRNGVLDGSLNTSYPGANVVATRHAFPTVAALTAQQAVAHVMEYAGPFITRDAVDTRLMQEVASYGTLGGVIVRESDLFPGYGTDPKYVNVRARLSESDADGMPDNWETARGYNPADGTDWKTLVGGYARLELYLNELGSTGTTVTSATGGAWTNPATWAGTLPTFADDVTAAALNVAGGNAFARSMSIGGGMNVTGGTLDVFDTAAVNGRLEISGGTASFGRLLLGSAGQTGTLALRTGGTIQTGTIATNGGTATIDWDGGTIRATGVPNVSLPTTLGSGGGTFDTNGYSGVYSGRITGSGALVKAGAGTLTLSGNNDYAGGTTVTGNLKLTHNNAAGTGPINITSGGGAVQLANGVTIANDIRTSYSFEVLDVPDAGAAATYAGNLTRNGSSQVRMQASGAGAWLNITGSVSAPNGFYFKTGQLNLRGSGVITGNGGAIGRGGGATTFLLRDNASFNIGGFSMGGGQALPSASITVIQNAALSTGAANLDLLNTTTATSATQLNLDGGTTTVGGFVKTSTGASQTSVINFNGGLLKYGGTSAGPNFLNTLPGLTANVRLGGARVDDNGQAVTIAAPLVHDAALGATRDGGLTKLGAGTLTLTAANTYTGGTNVQTGTLRVTRMHENNAVNVTSGKLQVMDSSPTLPLHPAGSNAFVSRPLALTIANNGAALGLRVYSGQLDLGNNDLILDYSGASPLADIEDMVRAGYNGGDWLGNGITSSTANANRNFAIGVADNARLTIPFDAGRPFSGQVVDTTTILVKFTHRIDLDLDGVITTNDATIFNSNYTEGAPAYWSIGDVDYDKVFTTNDATLFNSFYSEALASVPEPAALSVLGLGAALALRRRRQSGTRRP